MNGLKFKKVDIFVLKLSNNLSKIMSALLKSTCKLFYKKQNKPIYYLKSSLCVLIMSHTRFRVNIHYAVV